jgi:hypothetical protein
MRWRSDGRVKELNSIEQNRFIPYPVSLSLSLFFFTEWVSLVWIRELLSLPVLWRRHIWITRIPLFMTTFSNNRTLNYTRNEITAKCQVSLCHWKLRQSYAECESEFRCKSQKEPRNALSKKDLQFKVAVSMFHCFRFSNDIWVSRNSTGFFSFLWM